MFCKNGIPTYFANFTRKHLRWRLVFKEVAVLQSLTLSKQRFRHKRFFCELCKISHNTFLKEPFGRLLLHKHSFCLLSQHDALPFQKRCYTYFPTEYFLGLICRLVKRVSSIFQILSQKPISPQLSICDGDFCKNSWRLKVVKYFRKKVDVRPGSKYASISSH